MAKDRHPEQDPVEGSRKVIEHELAEQDKGKRSDNGGASRDESVGKERKQS